MEWCRAVTVWGKYRANKDGAGWMRMRLLCLVWGVLTHKKNYYSEMQDLHFLFTCTCACLWIKPSQGYGIWGGGVGREAFMVHWWALAHRQKKTDLLPEKSCQGFLRKGLHTMITKNCLFLAMWFSSAKSWEVFISSWAFITTGFSRLGSE